MWRHVTAQKWVATSDTAALFELCEVADMAQILMEDIKATGVKYEARGRWLRNPSVDAYFEAQKRLTTLLSLFGLTPADRTRLGIAEIKAKSKFEELLEQRGART
jgi:P27 family predicted phage terminase small subunit